MRFLQYLQEKYIGTAVQTWTDRTFPVFVNPDRSELQEIRNVRFFANFRLKKLVVWPANVLHLAALNSKDIRKEIKVGSPQEFAEKIPEVFSGYGEVVGGKIQDVYSDGLDYYVDHKNTYQNMKDEWTKVWFTIPLSKIILDLVNDYSE